MLCEMRGGGWGATLSCHFLHWLCAGLGTTLGQVALSSALGLSVVPGRFCPAPWASVVPQMLLLPSCFQTAAAEIRFNFGLS